MDLFIGFNFFFVLLVIFLGFVVIVVIISCINISNSLVMFGVGLLVKKVVDLGFDVKLYIKISLSLGSGVVTYYF